MPELPLVTVGVITYDRLDDIKRTVAALAEHLIYPRDRLRWLIADDASPGDYLKKLGRLKLFKDLGATFISTEANSGWGANANLLLGAVETDYLFFIEDDYVLTQPLDLRVGVALLETKPNLGMLRYRGTAGDHHVYHQFEADIGAVAPDFREHMGLPGRLTYLQFDGHSPSAYIYSHGPHLKRQRFHNYYGWYDEGRKLGETEEAFATRVKIMMQRDPANAPGIAILPEWAPMKFDHIGQSRQGTELDHAR